MYNYKHCSLVLSHFSGVNNLTVDFSKTFRAEVLMSGIKNVQTKLMSHSTSVK